MIKENETNKRDDDAEEEEGAREEAEGTEICPPVMDWDQEKKWERESSSRDQRDDCDGRITDEE